MRPCTRYSPIFAVADPRSGIAMIAAGCAALLLLPPSSSRAAQEEPNVQRGRVFVQTNCARCHSVGRIGESPLAIAPRFRDLHKKYPVESLAEAFGEGIVTGHPTMPEFRLDPGQINDVIGYLKSLE